MSDKARKLICALLAVILFTEPFYGGLMSAYATSTTDKIKQAEQEKKNAEQQLGQTQSTLNQLKDSKKAIQNSLNNLNEQLDETSDKMDDLQAQIDEKQANIEAVEKEYEDAVAQAAEQYKFIKVRIKKIYESGSDSIYDLLFNSSSMAEFLNKAVYIAKMNDYDDKMLAKMKALQEDAAEKKEILMEEDEELRQLYNEMEEEAGSLQELVDSTENSLVSYAGAISEKEKEALAYEAKLLANQQTISQLKSKLAEEEALAKQAEKMEFRDLSEVSVAAGDRDLLAAIIQCEAGGEPYAGKIAVGAVIMNRVRSAAFPNTIAGVVYQPMQFQPVRSGRLAIRLAEGANETCYKAADEVLAGANNIGKCLFFRTVVPGINGTIIGHHVFYLYWTGVASGYGTVEESLAGEDATAASKAASEAAASKAASEAAASEAASKEAASKEAASKEAASKEAASKEAASKAASEAAASKAASEAAASKAASEEASRKASEEASKKASEEAASKEAASKAASEENSNKGSDETSNTTSGNSP